MLRADVRDALFDTVFERYKINLLAAPHEAITCGSVVLVAGEDVFRVSVPFSPKVAV
jgi:hypothetical protein